MSYAEWRQQVLNGPPLDLDNSGDFDCVDVAKSWAMYLNPGVSWQDGIGWGNAKDLFDGAPDKYWSKLRNTGGSKPSVTPQQGDLAVYGPTPTPGYTNQFANPYGHIGAVDSVFPGGVVLIQQESGTGQKPHLANRYFTYSPLIGLLRPRTLTPEGGKMAEISDAELADLRAWKDKGVNYESNVVPAMEADKQNWMNQAQAAQKALADAQKTIADLPKGSGVPPASNPQDAADAAKFRQLKELLA